MNTKQTFNMHTEQTGMKTEQTLTQPKRTSLRLPLLFLLAFALLGGAATASARAVLTVAGIEALGKVYDGTTSATLIVSNAVLVGAASEDDVTLDTTNAVGAFADKDVGANKPVQVSGLALLGADADKYTLTQPTTNADITAANLMVTGVTASDKVYDGNTTATLDTSNAALLGLISGDDVTLDATAAAGASTDPNAGTGKTVLVSGLTISGADAGNYTLTQPTLTANILKADPVVTTWPVASAINYGQTLADSILSGGVATPDGSFAFTTPSTAPGAGTAPQGVTYTPSDTADYNLVSSTVNVTVNKTTLTVTATGLLIYGSDPSNAVYTASYTGFVGSDTNSVVSGNATFSTDATATDYIGNEYYARIEDLSGLSADNYVFVAGPDGVLVVTNRSLTVTNVLASDKVYDGTTDVTLDLSGAGLDGVVNGDDVTLNTSSVTAAFASPNAGLQTVIISGLALDGDLGTNYILIQPASTANILKADPVVTTWPEAIAITYGQTLADSILSGGDATPDGSFAFTTPSTAPGAGTVPQGVTYTPTDTDDYNTASSTVSVTVGPATSATVLVSSQNPSVAGSSVTFTVTVTPVAPASTTPTGSVQFYTNGVALGSPVALTAGVATLTTADLPTGANTVLAAYLGDDNFLPSTNSVAQVVNGIQTPSTIGIQNNGDGTVTVTFTGTPNARYVVQAADNVAAPAWVNISTNSSGADGQWKFSEPIGGHSARYYRSAMP